MTESFKQPGAAPTIEDLQCMLQQAREMSDKFADWICSYQKSNGNGQYFGAYGLSGGFSELRIARLQRELDALTRDQVADTNNTAPPQVIEPGPRPGHRFI